jgi:Initiator Replication protein
MDIRPYGNLDNKTASYPLPQAMAYTKVIGGFGLSNKTMTALDYKVLMTLLFLSHKELDKISGNDLWHEIKGDKLLSIFIQHGGTKDVGHLWESFVRIGSLIVEYQRIEGDRRFKGITSLLQIEEEAYEKSLTFRYRFPSQLVDILLNPQLFALLKVSLVLEMKSKYSIALYQILVPFADLKYKKSIQASLDEWKSWLKVPESTKGNSAWNRFGTFKQTVLEVAVEELNSKSHLTGFQVDYKLIKKGKGGAVESICFDIKKVSIRLAELEEVRYKEEAKEKKDDSSIEKAKELISYFERLRNNVFIDQDQIPEVELSKAKTFLKGLDSLEDAKSLVEIICNFSNKPDMFGGLFKHKYRAMAVFKERKAKKESNLLISKQKLAKQQSKSSIKESFELECKEYLEVLTNEQVKIIRDKIIKNANSFVREALLDNKNKKTQAALWESEVFKWWLKEEKGISPQKIRDIVL